MSPYFADIQQRLRDLWADRYEPHGARRFAQVYWRVLLIVAFIAFVVAIMYGERDLYRVLNDLTAVSPSTFPQPALDRSTLDAALTNYETRKQTFNALSSGSAYVPVADPSR